MKNLTTKKAASILTKSDCKQVKGGKDSTSQDIIIIDDRVI